MATVVPAEAISEEVRAFAATRGVEQFLDPIYDLTRHVFPTSRNMRVSVEPDPEIADYWFIVYEVEVPEIRGDEAVARRWEWCRSLADVGIGNTGVAFVISLETNINGRS